MGGGMDEEVRQREAPPLRGLICALAPLQTCNDMIAKIEVKKDGTFNYDEARAPCRLLRSPRRAL